MAKIATPERHNEGVQEFSYEPTVLQFILLILGVLGTFFIFIYNVSP